MSSNIEPADPGAPRVCKIADALSVVGERWSLLIVREISYGVTRFSDIQVNTGAPRQILTSRLRKLESESVIVREQYQSNPPRYAYHLTASGEALRPVLSSLRVWGESFA